VAALSASSDAPPASATSSISPADERPSRVLRVRVAGFPRRLLAAAVDLGILLVLSAGVVVAVALILGVPIPRWRELGPDLLVAGFLDRNPFAVGAAGLFAGLTALYQVYFGGIAGQTPGKRLVGLRVISVNGRLPGPARGTARLLALAVSVLPAGLGFLWSLFDREHRALHDHLAGTYVIVDS